MMKAKSCLFSVVCAVVVMMAPVGVLAGEYAHTVEVKGMTFSWTVNGANLDVRLSAKTDSWVGIGFNPSEAMKDAGFVLGYVKGGKVSVTDHFGTSKFQHMEDAKLGGAENVTNISGSESGGVTTIGFTIPLNSGDSRDAVIDPAGDTVVLLAHGQGRDSFAGKHVFRAELTVNLSTGAHR
jgi:hypothetical protein